MRRSAILIAAAAILVTACSSGSTPSPSAIPPAPPPTTSPAPPSPSPSPSPVANAEVTFDGTSCTYLGPKVVVSGTRMTIDFTVHYEPASVAHLIVAAVKEGTTIADIAAWNSDHRPSEGYPPYIEGIAAGLLTTKVGPGTVVVDLNDMTHAHAWTVDCLIPDAADIARNGALIQVVSS